MIETRVGEWTPHTRAFFNISCYLFAGLVIWDISKECKFFENYLFKMWGVVWALFAIFEGIYVYTGFSFGYFKYYILVPFVVMFFIDRFNR